MASSTVLIDILAHDQASGTFMKVAAAADAAGTKVDKFVSAGKAALFGIAAGVTLVAVESVKMAMKYQSAMELIHTQAGASQAEVDKMSKSILDLAGPVAQSPLKLADALFHIESTTLRGQRALDALKIAAEGATVGQSDLVGTTNALTATLVSGVTGAQDMSQAMGALNTIVGAGDMHMQDLVDALSGTGLLAAAKTFGVSLKDVGGALATFGDNGIRGADAATQLRMAMLALAKPVKGGEAALKSIGLTSAQLGKDMQTGGLNKAVIDLHDHLIAAGDSGDKMGQVILNAFGRKAGVGISVLESQFARYEQKVDQVSKGADTFGAAWTATTHTLSYQWNSLVASADAWAIKIGNVLMPIAEKLLEWFNKSILWMTKHRDVLIAVAVGITAALVPAMWSLVASFVALAAPIIGTVALFAGLALGVEYLWKKFPPFRHAVEDAAQGIQAAVHGISVAVSWMSGQVRAALAFLEGLWRQHGAQVAAVWHTITQIITQAVQTIVALFKAGLPTIVLMLQLAWDTIRIGVQVAWKLIKDTLSTELKVFADTFGLFADLFTGKWNKLWDDLKQLLSDAFLGITKIISDFISGVWQMGAELGTDFVNGIIHAITSAAGGIGDAITHALTGHSFTIPGTGISVPFASGGLVRGAGTGTSDSIRARLSNGEFVVNADAARRNMALLNLLNSGAGVPAFLGAPVGVAAPAQATTDRSAPLIGELHVHDEVGLDLALQKLEFRLGAPLI